MRLDRKLTAKLSPRLEPAAKLFARYRVRKSRSMLFKVMPIHACRGGVSQLERARKGGSAVNRYRRGISQAQKKSRHSVLELPTLEQRLVWLTWGSFVRGSIMAMFDFAVLVVKVLFFIWAIQLVWIGSRLLERPAKRVLRSVPKSHRSSASIKFLRLRSRHRSELFLR